MKPHARQNHITRQPLVSVVVVTYNRLELTRQCLSALSGQTYGNLELILVDNGSAEPVGDMLAEDFPSMKLISLEENTGFAGGYNRGIAASTGKYVAIINNDAVASRDWIEAMVKTAEADEQLGSVAAVVLNGQNPQSLDSFGVGIALDGMSRQVNHNRPPPDIAGPQDTLLASGCACMFRMAALKETGLFDEAFFAYCEDTDLGLRLRWAGYRCVVVPEARVLHYYSMTTEEFSINKVFWVERNHYWVAAKNFPIALLFLLPLFTVWRAMLQAFILLKGSSELHGFTEKTHTAKLIWTVIRANIAAVCGMPAMLRARYCYPKRVNQVRMIRTLMKYRLSIYQVLTGT